MVEHETMKLVVKEGYLQVAKCVALHHHHDPNTIHLIREFATKNSIKQFYIETWNDWKAEHLHALFDIFSYNKPSSIKIQYWLNGKTEANVDLFWSFFVGLLNSFQNEVYYLHLELENVQVMNVNWSFISKYITLNTTGSITQFVLTFGTFSRLQCRFEYKNLTSTKLDDFVGKLKGR